MKQNRVIVVVLLGAFSFLSGMDVPEVIVGQEQTSQGILGLIDLWETFRQQEQLTLTNKSDKTLKEILQAIEKHKNPIKFHKLYTAVQDELIKRIPKILKN